jgi:hypothetical protein
MPHAADPRPQDGRAQALQELQELEVFLGEQIGRLRSAGRGDRDKLVHSLEEIHAILSGGLQLVEAQGIQRRHAGAIARAAAERERAARARKQAAALCTQGEEEPLAPDEVLLDYDEELEFLQRQEQLPALILPSRLRAAPRTAPRTAPRPGDGSQGDAAPAAESLAAASHEDP